MRLEGKVAIVTGGGTGIGRGIALLFAKEGAKVVVAGRRKEPLDETVAAIKKDGGEAIAIQTNVSSSDEVSQMVETTLKTYGKVDILINNAGVYIPHDLLSATEDEWNTVINIDLKGVWLCSRTVLPHMIKSQKGKIVNIASIAGLIGVEQSAAYCAAKGAVVNLTREMALDYASKGIRINAIAPGLIETDMTKSFLLDEKSKQAFLEKTPVGRVGQPEDIGYAALYLASVESDFVTGHTLVVDGGWTIR